MHPMKKIVIPEDKQKHLVAGFIVAATVSLLLGVWVGVAAATLAGAGKEIYDKASGKGTPELADFLFTVAGALIYATFAYLLPWLRSLA